MRVVASGLLALVWLLPTPAATQPDFVLKAACIGGYANTVTEVAVAANGTVSRQHYFNSTGKGKGWQVLGRDPARLAIWLKTVDATKMAQVRVPAKVDRNACKVGGSRPCHIVRRKGNVDYYACQAESVLKEMMDFNEWTGQPRAAGSLEVLERWRTAYLDSDVDALVKLYAPDAQFIGTDSKQAIVGSARIREYFASLFLSQGPRIDVYTQRNNMVLSEDVVIVAGHSALPGVKEPVRITFVIARRGGEWLIVQFHASAMPM
jgi:uncharacterized protein (TIGR02246 family)